MDSSFSVSFLCYLKQTLLELGSSISSKLYFLDVQLRPSFIDPVCYYKSKPKLN